MKWTWIFGIRNKTVMFKLQISPRPILETKGAVSRIAHTPFHVLFMDYDYIDIGVLRDELAVLIEIFEIGSMYILETREDAYHVECLDYFLASEIIDIQETSNCDRAYIRSPLLKKHRSWVLRDEGKGKQPPPKLLEVVTSPFDGIRLQSCFHAEHLRRTYGVEIELKNPDNLDEGLRDKYLTSVKT